MEKAKGHVPIEQYGFIEIFSDTTQEEIDSLIENYNYSKTVFNKSQELKDPNAPVKLGEKMIENGHTYEAVRNEETKELYWLIKKV